MNSKDTFILNLGGSLIVPGEIDAKMLGDFRQIISDHIEKYNQKFVIVTGGGRTARIYQNAASEVIPEIPDEDKDWLGIHATRMNAQLLRTIFRDYAFPKINTNPHDLEDFYHSKDPVMIAAGWRPGFSTDYVTVVLAKYLGIKKIINLSNISHIYDKDPKENDDAVKIEEISWKKFRDMIGDKWTPGMNTPFDPVAAKYADEENLEVVTMSGDNLENLKRYLGSGGFEGSTIKNSESAT